MHGSVSYATASAYEYAAMKVGMTFPEDGYLPSQFSPIDLFDEDINRVSDVAKVHIVTLRPGDCMYIPAHWWFQSLSDSESELTVTVQHWYESSSSWADLILYGVANDKL